MPRLPRLVGAIALAGALALPAVAQGPAFDEHDGKLVLEGTSRGTFAEGPAEDVREFQTTLEILADGTLRDTPLLRQNGTWVTAHVQEFKPKAG